MLTFTVALAHRCQTQGTRAECGSPSHVVWPTGAKKSVKLSYNKVQAAEL